MNRKCVCLVILLALVLSISACTPPSVTPAPSATPESTRSPSQMEAGVQPPHPPTNLIGEPISQRIVSLQWSDNANNEDAILIIEDPEIIDNMGEKMGWNFERFIKALEVVLRYGLIEIRAVEEA